MADARRRYYMIGLQLASFLLLLNYCLDGGSSLLGLMFIIVIEVTILFQLRKPIKRIVLLWQLQFFIVALFGLVFYPQRFLNNSVIQASIQVFFLLVLLIIETAILLVYIFKERAVVGVLKASTISLICVMILLFAMVGSYGIAGFSEDNAWHMLTTDDFSPYLLPGYVSALNLTTIADPYDFNLSISNSVVHMAPQNERTVHLTLSNVGALNDSYELSADTPNGIDLNLSLLRVDLDAGRSTSFNGTIISGNPGNYSLLIAVSDQIGKVKDYPMQLVVANEGFDFDQDRMLIDINSVNSAQISIPLGFMNTGIDNGFFQLRINASSAFRPSLNIPEWNYSDNDAIIHLFAGEIRNCTLLPRMIFQENGQFQMDVIASSVNGNKTLATLAITLEITNNQNVYPQTLGPIPLSPGHATLWNLTVVNAGIPSMIFESPQTPSDLKVAAFLGGNETEPIQGGSSFPLNGSTVVTLSVSMAGQSYMNGSSFETQFVTGGGQAQFGMLGFMAGTLILTTFALIIAIPLAMGSAIFLAYYCPKNARRIIKPTMEIIAGIPSVIFGLWGALTLGPTLSSTLYPLIRSSLGSFIPFFSGSNQPDGGLMTAAVVVGIMIFPIIMTLSYEAMVAVPSELLEGSRALGTTKWQAIRTVVLKKAKSGVLGSIILGTGRAIGETMAVLMILGFVSEIPKSIFGPAGTMTSSIAATLLDVFASPNARDGIFAIALLLFLFVLALNALLILATREKVRTNREESSKTRSLWTRKSLSWQRPRLSDQRAKSIGLTRRRTFKSPAVLRRNDRIATAVLCVASAIVLAIVAYILLDIFLRGGLAFQLTYLTTSQVSGGGFLNAITGSLMLVGLALAISIPITLMAAIYVNEFTRSNSRLVRITYIAISTLSGTPSIIFGAFGFILFILILNFGFSLLSGALTLAVMILPLLYVSSIEGLKTVPNTSREASMALGASKWQTVIGVVIPSSIPAIMSGIFISIGRAMGETAAILLTAGAAQYITTSIIQPTSALPTMIYSLFGTSEGNPVLMEKIYAAAFILIVMVIALNLLGKLISYRYSKT